MPVEHVVPEIVLVVGAAGVLFVAMFTGRDRQWIAAPVAVGTLAAAAAFTVDLGRIAPQSLTFFGSWAIDGAGLGAKLVILSAAALVVVTAPEWLRNEPRHGEYYALLLFSSLGAIVMASAADTMTLVMGILLSSIPGYALAAYHRGSMLAVEAGMKFFLIGALTNALLLVGVVVLFGLSGTTRYAETAGNLPPASVALVAVAGLVSLGLVFKMGAAPAHAWMPDVAQGAPAPSAAFLTVVPKVGALVGLTRLLSLLPEADVGWRAMAAATAAVTMTIGNLGALWQKDVRRLLGWSAVSQSGYALMAIAVVGRSDLAIAALLYFVLAYALANIAAFAVVTELRGRTALETYAGLGRAQPALAAALVVSLLSLVGVPPLAGFAGKLTLFTAAIDGGFGWLAAVAVANTVVSLFYYLRVIAPLYFEEAPARVPVLGRWAGGVAVVGAGLAVLIGVSADPLLRAFGDASLLPVIPR